jgi:hypothetical protein
MLNERARERSSVAHMMQKHVMVWQAADLWFTQRSQAAWTTAGGELSV